MTGKGTTSSVLDEPNTSREVVFDMVAARRSAAQAIIDKGVKTNEDFAEAIINEFSLELDNREEVKIQLAKVLKEALKEMLIAMKVRKEKLIAKYAKVKANATKDLDLAEVADAHELQIEQLKAELEIKTAELELTLEAEANRASTRVDNSQIAEEITSLKAKVEELQKDCKQADQALTTERKKKEESNGARERAEQALTTEQERARAFEIERDAAKQAQTDAQIERENAKTSEALAKAEFSKAQEEYDKKLNAQLKSSMDASSGDNKAAIEQISNLEKQLNDVRTDREALSIKLKDSEERIQLKLEVKQARTEEPKIDNDKPTQQNAAQSAALLHEIPILTLTKAENLEEWIFRVKNALFLVKDSEENKLRIVASKVSFNALTILRAYMSKTTDHKLEEFYAELKRLSPMKSRTEELKTRILELKQGPNMLEYVNKFRTLVLRLEAGDTVWIDSNKMYAFMKGLNIQIKNELKYKKPKSIEEAYELAIDISESFRPAPRPANYVANVKKRRFDPKTPKKIICFNCQQEGHFKKDCKNPYVKYNPKETRKPKPEPKAGYNIDGMELPPCTNRATVINRARRSRAEFEDFAQGNMTLSSEELIFAKGNIKSKEVNLMLDTGATVSILDLSICRELGIEIEQTNETVQNINGDVVNLYGRTTKTAIDVEGNKVRLQFLVFENFKFDGMLGLDWFNKSGASIRPFTKELVIDEIEIIDDDDVDMICMTEVSDLNDEDTDDWVFEEAYEEPKMVMQVDLNSEQAKQWESIKKLIVESTAHNVNELGTCPVIEMDIELTSKIPIRVPPYRKAKAEEDMLEAEIKEMLDAGVIQLSKSPYSSPALMVPKKGTTKKRFVIDYRRLNAVTVTRSWPMRRIDDVLDKLAGAKIFSILDCKSGYWQIKLSEDSKKLTAFSSSKAHYEFIKVPFGLRNAPAIFCEAMFRMLGHLRFVEVYVDDIVIISNNIDEHFNHLFEVLTILNENNVKINSKGSYITKKIKFLGHIITNSTISMDPEKIVAVTERKPPGNVKELQCFLGLTNYYRKFVKDYSDAASPLYNLLKKETPWVWSESCGRAFETLKAKLVSNPILRLPDLNRPFRLYTDASKVALGAILAQIDDNGDEFVCSYSSRSLKGAELNYPIQEIECLAVVYAIKEYRTYLYGVHFEIYTDHKSLIWLFRLKEPTARLTRWVIYLQVFDFEVIYKKGCLHSNADALSRPVMAAIRTQTIADPYLDEPLLQFITFGKHKAGRPNDLCERIEELARNYTLDARGNIVFSNGVYSVIVPKIDDRRDVIKEAHHWGHFQVETTVNKIRQKHNWPSIRSDVQNFISNCINCQRNAKSRKMEHPAKAIEVIRIMDRVHIDLVFGLPETKSGNIGILLIVESLSKFPHAYAIKSKSPNEIARHLFDYISIFGPPKGILSDQGTEFKGMVEEMMKMTGIDHVVTAAYNPRCNGLAERTNQTVIDMIRKFCDTQPTLWDEWLPFVIMCYRARIHSTTSLTPDFLMFGRERNEFVDFNNSIEDSLNDRIDEIHRLHDVIYPEVKETIRRKQITQINTQNKRQNMVETRLKNGCKVLIEKLGITEKLGSRYNNKCTVIGQDANDNYLLKNALGETLEYGIPLHQLKVINEEDDDADVAEVKEILEHKKGEDGGMNYKVRWADRSETWIKTEDFETAELVANYWKKINMPKAKRGRPPKKRQVNMVHMLCMPIIFATVFALVMRPALAMSIKNTAKLCKLDNTMVRLDLSRLCHDNTTNNVFNKPITFSKVGLYYKAQNQAFGDAFNCKAIKYEYRFDVSFFTGSRTKTISSSHITLTPEECRELAATSNCFGHQMTCENEDCMYEPIVDEQYSWPNTNIAIVKSCIVQKRTIEAEGAESQVIGLPTCKVSDLHCKLHDSTLVWNQTVISKCRFKRVQSNIFRTRDNTTFTSIFNNIAFKVEDRSETSECGIKLARTTDGLYVHFNESSNDIERISIEERSTILNKLTIATIEGEAVQEKEDAENESLVSCQNIANHLSLIASRKNTITHVVLANQSYYLYSRGSALFKLECIDIDNMDVVTNGGKCFQHIEVEIAINNVTIRAFIEADGILRTHSPLESCEDTEIIFHNELISRKREQVIVKSIPAAMSLQVNEQFDEHINRHNPFRHPILLTEDYHLAHSSYLDDNEPLAIEREHEEHGSGMIKLIVNKLKEATQGIYISFIVFILLIFIIIFIRIILSLRSEKRKKHYPIVRLHPIEDRRTHDNESLFND